MYLIIGLGNPGKLHNNNRHNIGFQCIDAIARKNNLVFKNRFGGLLSMDEKSKVVLLKPMDYMNNSGISANKVKNFYKIKGGNTYIMYDDLDLALGKIRIKAGGSCAGHNGIKSIDHFIKDEYFKIKIGISRPQSNASITSYVLDDFPKSHIKILSPTIEYISSNFALLLQKDFSNFLNKYYLRFTTTRETLEPYATQ